VCVCAFVCVFCVRARRCSPRGRHTIPRRTQIRESFYPLQAAKDVCFELGRLLMGLKEYKAAAEFFVASNTNCGDHHVTWHNIGMCFFYLDQLQPAIAGFQRALELKPDYRESVSWLEKVTARVAGTGEGSSGSEEHDHGDGSDDA
jgi:hypothetical protein